MDKFTNAKFYVNKKEYEFAMDPIPLYYKSYEAPQLGITRPFEGIKMELLEGEAEIMPGVRVFETPGHSIGHQSVEIDTAAADIFAAVMQFSLWIIRNRLKRFIMILRLRTGFQILSPPGRASNLSKPGQRVWIRF